MNTTTTVKVLLVDDDALLRRVTKEFLETIPGVKILTAGNGPEALASLGEHEDTCVMVTDYHMGGMTGGQLIKEVKKKFPNIKTVIMSGGIGRSDIDGMPEDSKPAFFLPKASNPSVIKNLVLCLVTNSPVVDGHRI